MIILASVADTENVRKLVAMMDKDVPRGESNIQVYRLQNSIAEDLAKVLNSIIKETGSATSSGRVRQAPQGRELPRRSFPKMSRSSRTRPPTPW